MKDVLRAILIDDELSSLKNLRQKLEEFCKPVQVVAMAQKPEEALFLIRHHKPDVLFLDIEMPKMSGFEILEELGDYARRLSLSRLTTNMRSMRSGSVHLIIWSSRLRSMICRRR